MMPGCRACSLNLDRDVAVRPTVIGLCRYTQNVAIGHLESRLPYCDLDRYTTSLSSSPDIANRSAKSIWQVQLSKPAKGEEPAQSTASTEVRAVGELFGRRLVMMA
jgi:hypothetical protein